MVHPIAVTGFSKAAQAYERARPSYPAEAIDFICRNVLPGGGRALDAGAGTGKLTRLLAERRRKLVAVEPVAAMRAEFRRVLPAAQLVAAAAEQLPFRDQSFTAVLAAQAFHWFDGRAALSEFARVLASRGALVLLWNRRDESEPWVRELTRLLSDYRQGSPSYRQGRWKDAFEDLDLFTPLQLRSFRNQQAGPTDMLVERVTSVSFIAALPGPEKARLVERIRTLIAVHPDLCGRKEVVWPYKTNVYWCYRK